MKRISMLSALVLVTALLLTACGDNARAETTLPTEPSVATTAPAPLPQVTEPAQTLPDDHQHVLTQYEYGAEQHSYVCSCGLAIAESHDLDESGYCHVCGATVQPNSDGEYFILIHDEHGTLLSRTLYDAQENMIRWETVEPKYYSDGNLMFTLSRYGRAGSEKITTTEAYFVHRETGEGVRYDYLIQYDSDGSRTVFYYDAHENTTEIDTYNAQGELSEADKRVYEYDPDGVHVYLTRYINEELWGTIDYIINDAGELVQTSQTWYKDGKKDFLQDFVFDTEGNLVEVVNYTFDENGNPVLDP